MLLDSNVLIYALNEKSPEYQTAKKFIAKNLRELEIADQNIFETFRVLTHPTFPTPMSAEQALKALGEVVKKLTVVQPLAHTHLVALDLIKKYDLKGNKIFDAYLVATALSNDIRTIAIGNEKDLGRFKEITTFNPFKSTPS